MLVMFFYQDLKSGEDQIRALRVYPATNTEAPVEALLEVVSLQNAPTYTALSYVWGAPLDTRAAKVNGERLYITVNLELALRHIRHESEDILVWADALCINQVDNEERELQVLKMRDIYSTATDVVGWLGASKDDSDLAMDSIKRLGEGAICQNLHLSDDLTSSQLDCLSALLEAIGPEDEIAIRSLFQRQFWTRRWIVQEMVLAKRLTLMCGRRKLKFEAFTAWDRIMGSAINYGLHSKNQYIAPIFGTDSRNILGTWETLRDQFADQSSVDFLHLLTSAYHYETTDPRDRIYSLLSISDAKKIVRVDYGRSEREVFLGFIVNIVRKTSSLDILAQTDPSQGEEKDLWNLPSWVPTWYHAAKYREVAVFDSFARPWPSRLSPSIFSSDYTVLNPEGISVGAITCIIPGDQLLVDPREFFGSAHASRLLSDKHVIGMPLLQAFFRLMLQDEDPYRHYDPLDSQQDSFYWLAAGFLYCLHLMNYLGPPGVSLYNLVRDPVPDLLPASYQESVKNWCLDGKLNEDLRNVLMKFLGGHSEMWPEVESGNHGIDYAQKFMFHANGSLSGRICFQTDYGHFGVASSSSNLERGDVVVLLNGLRTPAVLRPLGGDYTFISACFVLGLMDGKPLREAMDIFPDTPLKTFRVH
jgi:hypothetical protein